MSLSTDQKRLSKNARIKASKLATKKRRASLTPFAYDIKIISNKMSKQQKETLDRMFVEAKWYYNDIISFIDGDRKLSAYDTKAKQVSVRLGKESSDYECRDLKSLSASVKQKIKERVSDSLNSLKALKDKGYKVGKLGYTKEVSSLPLKQYGRDFLIISKTHVRVVKLGSLRVRGLDQISQEADIATAVLTKEPDGYHIKITAYIPLELDLSWVNKDVVGIDLGIKDTITTSTGEKFKVTVSVPPRIKGLQRKLSRQIKGSVSYIKTIQDIRREYQRINRLKDEKAREIVNHLLEKHSFIVMQDENIAGWHKGIFGKQVQASILGRVKTLLVKNPRVAVIDRCAPTTQLCTQCGALNKHPLSERIYHCGCGYHNDRDVHAAQNMIHVYLTGHHNLIKKHPAERGITLVECVSSARC